MGINSSNSFCQCQHQVLLIGLMVFMPALVTGESCQTVYEEKCEMVPRQVCNVFNRGRTTSTRSNRDCNYKCTSQGGCEVSYVGPYRGGQTLGSCSPQSYGGGCSGTPRECQDCNRAITC